MVCDASLGFLAPSLEDKFSGKLLVRCRVKAYWVECGPMGLNVLLVSLPMMGSFAYQLSYWSESGEMRNWMEVIICEAF